MVRKIDRQGEVLMWCRKCSGYARQKMGPKLMQLAASQSKWAQKSTENVEKTTQILEDGRITCQGGKEVED